MTERHSAVVSSRGSRRPELDRQCTQARLQAYVSSQVRQIGEVSPSSNMSVRRPAGRRTAAPGGGAAERAAGAERAVWAVWAEGRTAGVPRGTIIWELASVARARAYVGSSGSGTPATAHASRAVG